MNINIVKEISSQGAQEEESVAIMKVSQSRNWRPIDESHRNEVRNAFQLTSSERKEGMPLVHEEPRSNYEKTRRKR